MAENENEDVYSGVEEDIPGTKVVQSTLSKEITLGKQLLGNLKPTFKYDKSDFESYFDRLVDKCNEFSVLSVLLIQRIIKVTEVENPITLLSKVKYYEVQPIPVELSGETPEQKKQRVLNKRFTLHELLALNIPRYYFEIDNGNAVLNSTLLNINMHYIKKLVESTIPKVVLAEPQYRDINNKVFQPLKLLDLLQYNTDKIIPKVVDFINSQIMPLLKNRGTADLQGYSQKLNEALNKLNVFLSHPDLADVSFQNVLLLSAVISAGNKNDVYETQTTIALNSLSGTDINPAKIMEIIHLMANPNKKASSSKQTFLKVQSLQPKQDKDNVQAAFKVFNTYNGTTRKCWICQSPKHVMADCPQKHQQRGKSFKDKNPKVWKTFSNKYPKGYKSSKQCFKGEECTKSNCPYQHPPRAAQHVHINTWGGNKVMFLAYANPPSPTNGIRYGEATHPGPVLEHLPDIDKLQISNNSNAYDDLPPLVNASSSDDSDSEVDYDDSDDEIEALFEGLGGEEDDSESDDSLDENIDDCPTPVLVSPTNENVDDCPTPVLVSPTNENVDNCPTPILVSSSDENHDFNHRMSPVSTQSVTHAQTQFIAEVTQIEEERRAAFLAHRHRVLLRDRTIREQQISLNTVEARRIMWQQELLAVEQNNPIHINGSVATAYAGDNENDADDEETEETCNTTKTSHNKNYTCDFSYVYGCMLYFYSILSFIPNIFSVSYWNFILHTYAMTEMFGNLQTTGTKVATVKQTGYPDTIYDTGANHFMTPDTNGGKNVRNVTNRYHTGNGPLVTHQVVDKGIMKDATVNPKCKVSIVSAGKLTDMYPDIVHLVHHEGVHLIPKHEIDELVKRKNLLLPQLAYRNKPVTSMDYKNPDLYRVDKAFLNGTIDLKTIFNTIQPATNSVFLGSRDVVFSNALQKWHCRLGHISEQRIWQLHQNNWLPDNITMKNSSQIECPGCLKCVNQKHIHKPRSEHTRNATRDQTYRPGECYHVDGFYLHPDAHEYLNVCLLFVDQASHYNHTVFIESENMEVIVHALDLIQSKSPRTKLKMIKYDNHSAVFNHKTFAQTSEAITTWKLKNRVDFTLTTDSEQNLAETTIHILRPMEKRMRANFNLPVKYQIPAIRYANILTRLLPSQRLGGRAPIQEFYNRNPAKYLKRMRTLFCDAYVNPRQGSRQGKKTDNSLELHFIGMDREGGPYVFINKRTGTIVKTYHAVFNELSFTPSISDGGAVVHHDINQSLDNAVPIDNDEVPPIIYLSDDDEVNEHQAANEVNEHQAANHANEPNIVEGNAVADHTVEIRRSARIAGEPVKSIKVNDPTEAKRLHVDMNLFSYNVEDFEEEENDYMFPKREEMKKLRKTTSKSAVGLLFMRTIMTLGAFLSESLVYVVEPIAKDYLYLIEDLNKLGKFGDMNGCYATRPESKHTHPTLIKEKYYADEIPIPKTLKEALKSQYAEEWKIAVEIENTTLKEHGTFTVVDEPNRCHKIGTKYVFALKRDEKGNIKRFKARLVAKGYSQMEGKEYGETYSPVVALTTVLILITLAVRKGWKLMLLDFKGAFLHSKMPEKYKIYINTPYGMKIPMGKVVKLNKSLYGTKNASHLWWEDLRQALLNYGFIQSKNDPCLFTYKKDGYICILCTFVDDLIIGSSNEKKTQHFINLLESKGFVVSSFEELSWYLGINIRIERNSGKIKVLQTQYIKDLITQFHMEDKKPTKTPLLPANVPNKNDCPTDDAEGRAVRDKVQTEYRSLLGKLSHLARHTRPDIKYVVFLLSRYQHNPGPAHLQAAYYIIRYLKGTIDEGITLNTTDDMLTVYCDADHASDKDSRRSTSGYCMFVYGGCVYSKSTQQKCVALSSTESELIALSRCVRDVLWIRNLLYDFDLKVKKTIIYEDNMGAIHLAKDSALSQRTKHIAIAYYFIRDHIIKNQIDIQHIDTKENIADIFTKAMNSVQQCVHATKLWYGLTN